MQIINVDAKRDGFVANVQSVDEQGVQIDAGAVLVFYGPDGPTEARCDAVAGAFVGASQVAANNDAARCPEVDLELAYYLARSLER